MRQLRILHISDLHERAAFDGMPTSREKTIASDARHRGILLGEQFSETLKAIAAGGIDIVCFTGDLADWGVPSEYEKATQRLDKILKLVSVPRARFFAIPGNHDVQRSVNKEAWLAMRTWLTATSDVSGLGRWVMGPNGPPYGTKPEWLPDVLRRTEAFWAWLKDFRGDDLRAISAEQLGYRSVIAGGTFEGIDHPIHIVGLDSAWLCGAEEKHDGRVFKDQGGIVVTKEQVDAHTRDGEHALDGYRIALVHHPLDHLADHTEIRRLLGDDGVDILLHGHQHFPSSIQNREPGSNLRVVAAGCLVEGDLGRDWPNGFQVIEINPVTRAGNITFRKWSKDGRFWANGSDIYRDAPNGVLHFDECKESSDSVSHLQNLPDPLPLYTATVPNESPPTTISGWAWRYLDEVSQYRGYIQTFRQHYLVSEQAASLPFGGRDDEFQRLDAWLSDTAAPGRYLICAPTARGKSALLVQWTERLESNATWAVVFVPISLRFSTDRPTVFYALLATQLACVLQVKLEQPSTDLHTYYQGVSSALLSQASTESRHVLIVVDGLDEAQGANFNPTVFPPSLPPNVKILVSAREQVGDRGPEGWLKRLSWQGSMRAISEDLSVLDRKAVSPILESAGVAKEAVSDALIDRLMVLTAGEPLLLALYAEDLSSYAKENAGNVGVEVLDNLTPGFAAYFSRAFDAESLADHRGDQEDVDTTLAVLAMALGPLEAPHLTDLVCGLRSLPRPTASDRFVRPLKRFIAGDGRVDHGFVLNHPKLGEYLREERFDETTRQLVERAFIAWGRGIARGLAADPNAPTPAYVLRRHVDHLCRAGGASLDDIELLLTNGWRQSWFRIAKDYLVYADSLLDASASMQPCATYIGEASRALRLRIKIALMVGSVKSQGINVPSELLSLALQEQLITIRQALNVAELQLPENRVGYLLDLAPALPAERLEQLHLEVLQNESVENRNAQLARLAPHLPAPLRGQVTEQLLKWLRMDPHPRLGIIAALAPVLDDAQLDAVLTDGMSKALTGHDAASTIISLIPVMDTLRGRGKPDLTERFIDQCLRQFDVASNPLLAVEALGMLASHVSVDRIKPQLAQLAPLVTASQIHHTTHTSAPWDTLAKLQHERIKGASATLAVLDIDHLPAEIYKTTLMTTLAVLFVPDYWAVDSLMKIVPMVRADVRQEIVAMVHQLALNLPTANNRTHALMKLAKTALPPLRHSIVEQGLLNARRIEDDYSRGLTLVALFSTLPAADKPHELTALMVDINKVNYVLHVGELLTQLSNQLSDGAAFAVAGLQAIQRAEDVSNGTSTMLREMERIPPHMREAVFQECWRRIHARSDDFSGFQFGMAAHYATEFWTPAELEVVRKELARMAAHVRTYVLIALLPVAVRHAAHDLIAEAFDEIAAQENPNDCVSAMVKALNFLPTGDPRRKLLPQSWFLAVDSDNPRINSLIDAFDLMDPEDQVVAWPKLMACAKIAAQAGQSLARLSVLAKNSAESIELLEAAFVACAGYKPDDRISQAAQIVLTCKTPEGRWRAFDLMTAIPSVSRDTFMSVLRLVAPVLAEVGSASLTRELMDDVRQCAFWWP